MINGSSTRESAKVVGISIPASFYWRHKILDAIRVFIGIGSGGGVIEVDEVVQSHTSHIDIKLKDFKIREAIYV